VCWFESAEGLTKALQTGRVTAVVWGPVVCSDMPVVCRPFLDVVREFVVEREPKLVQAWVSIEAAASAPGVVKGLVEDALLAPAQLQGNG
jgi:hypothetical protein